MGDFFWFSFFFSRARKDRRDAVSGERRGSKGLLGRCASGWAGIVSCFYFIRGSEFRDRVSDWTGGFRGYWGAAGDT